ncbi:MAG: hypothetical protein AAGC55_13365, partial [Myxococcota bacterium]
MIQFFYEKDNQKRDDEEELLEQEESLDEIAPGKRPRTAQLDPGLATGGGRRGRRTPQRERDPDSETEDAEASDG